MTTALVASADEGSPVAPVSPSIRPPLGVLRHVDAARATYVPGTQREQRDELVVLVGGYQSCACPDDGTFDALRKRLAIAGGFTVIRFGADPRYPYDTFGSVDASAANLRDEIRALSGGHTAVHLVTHSMGGVVADRAFAQGLSRADGVVTYVSWSAPHDGSDAAQAVEFAQTVTQTDVSPLRESLLWLQMEPNSRAVRDIAHVRATVPPRGVVRLDLREATDVLVTGRDARDPGVASRVLTGRLEGHGGILDDPEAIDLTLATISSRAIPPDARPRAVRLAADEASRQVGGLVLVALCLLTCAACVAGFVGRSTFARGLTGALRSFVPHASRKRCP
jgi:pimeloyl-ACP methyl ester carboxylesterase